jgi:protein-disulfide isomerase
MRRLAFAAALAAAPALGPALGPAHAQEALTPAQQEAVDARIRAYLLANPEIVVEALEALEARRREAQAQADVDLVAANAAALFQDGFSHVSGNPEGDVTIVEFSDYRCGYCKAAHPVVAALLAADPGIRLVTKDFPILGPESTLAARVAMAARRLDPAAFAGLHEALMTTKGGLDEAAIFRMAAAAGFDEAALRLEMEDPAIAANLRATYELARTLGLEGTPSFVIGGRIVRGFVQADQLEALVAEARRDRG